MTHISPYIIFNGNCREAMTFYKRCLGGELTLQSVEESPMAGQWPASAQKRILHASLVKNNLLLQGSDMGGPDVVANGNMISLSLNCSSEKEIHDCFTSLAEGGKIIHPPHSFFDGTIGSLTDKYGLNWILKF
jgi:PhnB protein